MSASYMAAEIASIPDRLADGLEHRRRDVPGLVASLRDDPPDIVFVAGRGSSSHAARYARYLAEIDLGVPSAEVLPSVTTIYGRRHRRGRALLLAFSQSGQGPDLTAAVRDATAAGVRTVAITNDVESPLAAAASERLPIHAGREHSLTATVTYVAELAAVAWLIAEIARPAWRGALDELPAAVRRAHARSLAQADAVATLFDDRIVAQTIGRGYNAATADEVALKLIEAANVPTLAYSAAGFIHGPLTLAGPASVAISFHVEGPTTPSVHRAATAAFEAGAASLTVAADRAPAVDWMVLPLELGLPEALTPLAMVVPGQVIAERIAQRRGLDPDAPRSVPAKVVQTI